MQYAYTQNYILLMNPLWIAPALSAISVVGWNVGLCFLIESKTNWKSASFSSDTIA